MPNITNVTLHLQHGGRGRDITSRRSASVDFSVRFTSTEVLAGVVYRAIATIRSVDGSDIGGRTLNIGNLVLKAEGGTISRTITSPLGVTRGNLDEDVDFKVDHNNPANPNDDVVTREEDNDEWLATVTMEPVQFTAATRNSDIVVGSWGVVGVD
jgi:hypothetical protein